MRNLEIFGRPFVVNRTDVGWVIYYPGAEGKRGPRFDLPIPSFIVTDEELRQFLADICHEWASPSHPEVRWGS